MISCTNFFDDSKHSFNTFSGSGCGHGWVENPETGECYKIMQEFLRFGDARHACRELSRDESEMIDIVALGNPGELQVVRG